MYESERRRSGSFRSIQSKSSYKGSRKYQLDETPARDRKSTKSLLPIPASKVSTWYKSEAVPGEGATVNDLREEARRQQDYSIHRASLYSPRSHISLTLLLTYDFVLYVAYTPWEADFISEVIPEIVISSLLCLCTILGWAAWTYSFYVQRKRRRTSVDINTLRSRSKHVSRNQILNTAHFIFTFLVVALLIFYYSYRALHPSVVPLSATISGMFSSACNSQTSALSSIPQLQSLILILLPISYQILICGQNTRPPHLLWISIGITILVCILSFQLWSPASFLLFLILGHIGVLMSEVHSQSQATYNYFIQEMELMEALLMDRAKETDHKNKATELQRMIGNIAHDVKSPLASLRLGLDGLMSSLIRKEYAFDLSGIPTTNTAEENVSSAPATTYSVKEEIEICHSLEHGFAFLSMTISRAMDFQRTNKGFALIPDLTYIHLEPLVSRVVDCCKSTKAGAIIHVKPLARRLQAKVYTDESWLFDNLLCLVANAVKYTEDDVVSIRIQLRTEGGQDGQDFLRFEIEDSGPGLSAENKVAVFSLFNDDQRKVGGSGLGLFCLSRRCQALGGSCGVKDRQKLLASANGAIFWFEIPFITYRKRALTSTSPQSPLSDASISGNGPLSRSCSNQSLASQACVDGHSPQEESLESTGNQRKGRSSRKYSPNGSPARQTMFKKLSLIDDNTSTPPSAKLMSLKGIISRLSFKSSSPKPNVSAKGSPLISGKRKKNVSGKSNFSDRSSGSFKRKGGGSMKDAVRGISDKLLSGRFLKEEEQEFSSVLHPMSSSALGNSSSSSNGQGFEEEEEDEEKVFSRSVLVIGEDLDLIRMLRGLEYHVDFAESGLSAYELLRRKPYDAVLLSLTALSESAVLLFLQKYRYMEKSSSSSSLRAFNRKQLILVLIDAYSEDGGELFINMGASFVFAEPLTQQQLLFALESDQANHNDHSASKFEGQYSSNDTMPFPGTVVTSAEDEEDDGRRRRLVVEASSSDSLISASSNHHDRAKISRKQSTLHSMHVLLVDDSSLILKTLARTFQAGKYQVSQAENGAVALDMMVRNMGSYDAVLIDQQMPVMDGPECVRRFREQEVDALHTRSSSLRRQLIIGMSANSDEVCKSNAYDAGMDFFLQKPFPLERVEDVVRQHFNMGSYCLDEDFGGVDEFIHPGTVRP